MRGGDHRPALLLPVLVCTFLGVMCSVASTIVAVLTPDGGQFTPRTSSRHDISGDRTIYVFTVRRTGYWLMTVTGPMPTRAADALDELRSQTIPTKEGDPRPAWLRSAERLDPQISRGVVAGWPFLSLWGHSVHNVNHDPQATNTGLAHVSVRGVRHAFPWRPLWLGMAANTAIYGGLLLALWYTCVFAVRRLRSERGRCPRCGYPKGDGAARCPECGYEFAVAASSGASASCCSSSAQTTSTLTSKSSSSDER